MWKNYVKIALRNMWKQRLFSLINMVGMGIGLAGFCLIGLYIYSEWQVDRFHENQDRLYRVITTFENREGDGKLSTVGQPLARTILAEVPEAATTVPIRRSGMSIRINDQYHQESMLYVGEDFLNVFSFPLHEGDPARALSEPFQTVISADLAEKYFPGQSAIGQTFQVQDTLLLTVSGVMAPAPPSHMDFDMLLSWPTLLALGATADQWFTWNTYCYVLLKEGVEAEVAEDKIAALSMKHHGETYRNLGYEVSHELETITDIHLYSGLGGIYTASGSIKKLRMLALIGFVILLLACVNFINLSTAVQDSRRQEVGIRKTMGAGFGNLVSQFFTESFLLIAIGGILALVIVQFTLPFTDYLFGKTLPVSSLLNPFIWIAFLLLLLGVGFVAGSRPAVTLAKIAPLDALRRPVFRRLSALPLRKVLVTFQFSVSVVLIVATLVALQQLKYMQQQSLGFDQENVLVLDIRKVSGSLFSQRYDLVKDQLGALPGVQSVSAAAGLPGRGGWRGQIMIPEGYSQENAFTGEVVPVDHDYVKTLGLNVIAGRDMSEELSTDEGTAVLINQAASAAFGWSPEEAVGKTIETPGVDQGRIIGVLENFHQHGLQEPIKPILAVILPNYQYLALRLTSGDPSSVISQAESVWQTQFPGYTFEHFFLDDDFNRQYEAEQRLSHIFAIFAGLAIFIACLGLLGLATFAMVRKTKEVGIRKILGASVESIVGLLSRELIGSVAVALLIALPVAWYLMHSWLADFAHRVELSWWIFALAGILTILIAFATIAGQAIRVAVINPVDSLRQE